MDYPWITMDYLSRRFLFIIRFIPFLFGRVVEMQQNVRNRHRWQQNVTDNSVAMTVRQISFVMNF